MESGKVSAGFRVKRALAGTSLLALGVAFELVSGSSKELKEEIESWPDGLTFAVGVLPGGPTIVARKEGGRLRYLGKGDHGASLFIYFKNVDSALMPLLGIIGSHTAFAQHRAIIHGSLDDAMKINRAMAIVQKFLMPGFIMNKISKRPPPFSSADYLVKAKVMALLTPYLVAKAFK